MRCLGNREIKKSPQEWAQEYEGGIIEGDIYYANSTFLGSTCEHRCT